MSWPALPRPVGLGGELRRVGAELELSEVTPRHVAEIVRAHHGGTLDVVSEYEYRVVDTVLGDFRIEVDLTLLKRLGRELATEGAGDNEFKRWSTELLARASRPLVPVEIVTPPLLPAQLPEFDAIIPALRAAGAKGTSHSTFYAFGVHLNPQVPDCEPESVLGYLRAFMCLYDCLKTTGNVDLSRRVTPFINRYPVEYEELVLDARYRPQLDELIHDYLEFNPTRNRALDLLPLLAWARNDLVCTTLPDEKVNPRPTFHYRLPNCEIDDPAWSLLMPWREWLQVEHLAADEQRLRRACAARRRDMLRFAGAFDDRWCEESRQWLTDL